MPTTLVPQPPTTLRRHSIIAPRDFGGDHGAAIQHVREQLQDLYHDAANLLQFYIWNRGCAAFGSHDTEVAIAFESPAVDASYVVFATPTWDTTIWFTDLATTGFTLHVGTSPITTSSAAWIAVRGGPTLGECEGIGGGGAPFPSFCAAITQLSVSPGAFGTINDTDFGGLIGLGGAVAFVFRAGSALHVAWMLPPYTVLAANVTLDSVDGLETGSHQLALDTNHDLLLVSSHNPAAGPHNRVVQFRRFPFDETTAWVAAAPTPVLIANADSGNDGAVAGLVPLADGRWLTVFEWNGGAALSTRPAWSASADGGLTWTTPIDIEVTPDVQIVEPKMALIGTTPVLTSKGNSFFHAGDIVGWTFNSATDTWSARQTIMTIADGGATPRTHYGFTVDAAGGRGWVAAWNNPVSPTTLLLQPFALSGMTLTPGASSTIDAATANNQPLTLTYTPGIDRLAAFYNVTGSGDITQALSVAGAAFTVTTLTAPDPLLDHIVALNSSGCDDAYLIAWNTPSGFISNAEIVQVTV